MNRVSIREMFEIMCKIEIKDYLTLKLISRLEIENRTVWLRRRD